MDWLKWLISAAVIAIAAWAALKGMFFGKRSGEEKDMYVIIGLGNPGREYAATKHNVGFMVIDKLAEKYNIDVSKFKHKALTGDGIINGKKVMLVKPQTYMNLSGESVREIMSFYKVPEENMIVIYDDTSLEIGMIRLREKGSAGGHNGIKSIISHMGTDVFNRVKVGIGEKPAGWDLADYVLAKFSKDDEPGIEAGTDKAAQAVEIFISLGVKEAMNRFNAKQKIKKKDSNKDNDKDTNKDNGKDSDRENIRENNRENNKDNNKDISGGDAAE